MRIHIERPGVLKYTSYASWGVAIIGSAIGLPTWIALALALIGANFFTTYNSILIAKAMEEVADEQVKEIKEVFDPE